ncbi:hypothetical protein ABT369_28565 [Dactylosporangium sp. NPDC000244]|uniref:hypothetical protein n=1 Tax=Dactylosporangium sp. NPDC000244 TaxID=3154365 RepID=UPI00332FA1EF
MPTYVRIAWTVAGLVFALAGGLGGRRLAVLAGSRGDNVATLARLGRWVLLAVAGEFLALAVLALFAGPAVMLYGGLVLLAVALLIAGFGAAGVARVVRAARR